MSINPLVEAADLTGRNVIVTGSTSGIGKGIAEALARAGCNVLINGFGATTEIEAFRSRLQNETGAKIVYSNADMSNPVEIEDMFVQSRDELGVVHGVVNNAGIQHVAPVEAFTTEKWDKVIAINLTSAFHTTRLAFADMKSRGWGRIINIGSAHSLTASPFKSAYVTAKHGLLGLTRTTALEGAEFGIRVNLICPGYVRTPMVEGQIADTARARNMPEERVIKEVMLDRQPTKEFTTVEEIARMCCLLMSDAAPSINGAEIKMEGGWCAQ